MKSNSSRRCGKSAAVESWIQEQLKLGQRVQLATVEGLRTYQPLKNGVTRITFTPWEEVELRNQIPKFHNCRCELKLT